MFPVWTVFASLMRKPKFANYGVHLSLTQLQETCQMSRHIHKHHKEIDLTLKKKKSAQQETLYSSFIWKKTCRLQLMISSHSLYRGICSIRPEICLWFQTKPLHWVAVTLCDFSIFTVLKDYFYIYIVNKSFNFDNKF